MSNALLDFDFEDEAFKELTSGSSSETSSMSVLSPATEFYRFLAEGSNPDNSTDADGTTELFEKNPIVQSHSEISSPISKEEVINSSYFHKLEPESTRPSGVTDNPVLESDDFPLQNFLGFSLSLSPNLKCKSQDGPDFPSRIAPDEDEMDSSIPIDLCHSRELSVGICNLGTKNIVISKDEKCYELLLRPDISEDMILALLESVMMTVGGGVKRIQTESEFCLEVSSHQASTSAPVTARVHIGVNTRKQRAVVVHVSSCPTSGAFASIASTVRNGGMGSSLQSFGEQLMAQLSSAVHTEGFTISRLLHLYHLCSQYLNSNKNFDSSGEMRSQVNVSQNLNAVLYPSELISMDPGLKSVSSVIDPGFVRDLQSSYAQDMLFNIKAVAGSLESYVTIVERQCARLMTILKPMFTRCGLTMPFPPPKKPLSEYALALARKPIEEVSVEMSRLLILRARRAVKEKHSGKNSAQGDAQGGADTGTAGEHGYGREHERDFISDDGGIARSLLSALTVGDSTSVVSNRSSAGSTGSGVVGGATTRGEQRDLISQFNALKNRDPETEAARQIRLHLFTVNQVVRHIQGQLQAWSEEEGRARVS